MRKNQLLSILPLCLSALLTNVALSQNNFEWRCNKELPQTSIVVSESEGPYLVHNNVSSQKLRTMSTKTYSTDYILGLTARHSIIQIDFEGPIIDDKNSNQECFAPRIEINMEHPAINVYVGKEFPENSCAYNEILEHEMQHVKLYKEKLPALADLVRAKMGRRYENTPLIGPIGKTKEQLNDEINRVWMPFVKNELEKIEDLQAALDSEDEYTRLSWSCLGQVQTTLGFRDRR
ncbi:hypothetical protein [Undibacterium sp. RuTC16W]|uniref:hypothetical protein n=1 Tax=Undibacterium sp. RuTC16W TaxID=3413048 RepID=UPI003BF29E0C